MSENAPRILRFYHHVSTLANKDNFRAADLLHSDDSDLKPLFNAAKDLVDRLEMNLISADQPRSIFDQCLYLSLLYWQLADSLEFECALLSRAESKREVFK